MNSIVHIIDTNTQADSLLQLARLRQADEPVVCLGTIPAGCNIADIQTVETSIFPGHRRENLARAIPRDVRIVHCWSIKAFLQAKTLPVTKLILSLPHTREIRTTKTTSCPCKSLLNKVTCSNQSSLISLLVSLSNVIVTLPAESARESLIAAGLPAERVRVLPPVATPEPLALPKCRAAIRADLGLAEKDILLAGLGEMTWQAGQKYLAWAHGIVRQVQDNGRLVFPGDGPSRQTVRAFAKSTGFGAEAFFTRNDYSLDEILAACDVACVLYEKDSGLQTLASALTSGRPVIATQTPDVLSLGIPDSAAAFVPPANPREISSAVLRLIEQADQRQTLAENGMQWATKNFATDIVEKKRQEIYAT